MSNSLTCDAEEPDLVRCQICGLLLCCGVCHYLTKDYKSGICAECYRAGMEVDNA